MLKFKQTNRADLLAFKEPEDKIAAGPLKDY
jgi:hypothetical protein